MALQNYFDYAAATPMLPEVVAAMQPYFSDQFYNPSALYLAAKQSHKALEEARHQLAQSIGARPTEIIFTAGGTEANNLAIHGIMKMHAEDVLLISAIEHDSVIKPSMHYTNSQIMPTTQGTISPEAVVAAITDKTVLVSVMYANNEIGTIAPIASIAEAVQVIKKDRRERGVTTPLYLHTDACQAANYLDLQVSRLGIDLMTINAGKVYGPKQCGALYVKAGIVLQPLVEGGGQEWNMRSGSENLANIVGFVTAWQRVRGSYKSEAIRVSQLRDHFVQTITQAIPSAIINGATGSRRLANNISLTIPGFDNERVLMMLDEVGIQVATGSACNASNDEPSHVLAAIGITDEHARQTLRITLGRFTTEDAVQNLCVQLTKIVAIK